MYKIKLYLRYIRPLGHMSSGKADRYTGNACMHTHTHASTNPEPSLLPITENSMMNDVTHVDYPASLH